MHLGKLRFMACILLACCATAQAANSVLRVAVLERSVPMSYRDERGELTGFTVGIMRALCEEMQASCQFKVVSLHEVVDGLVHETFDVAAVSLLDTPERRAKILLSKPFFRSRTLWFSRKGVTAGTPGLRVAAVAGSAQEAYARTRGWKLEPLASNDQIGQVLQANQADAGMIPMPTALALMQQPGFLKLGLQFQVMEDPGLGGDVCLGIAPRQTELKARLDAALERIKRNGRYDKINSEFLPFRVD